MDREFSGTLGRIVDSGVVAVMRGAERDVVVEIAEALLAGGVTALELTADSEHVVENVTAVRDAVGDEAVVGTGTVYDAETARAVVDTGAEFVVSPTVEHDVIGACNDLGVTVAPGAFTPTEVRTAYQAGADAVKVFPAASAGPKHLSRIGGPMPEVPLMPTGGVDLDSAADYVRAGAVAVGVGSALVPDDLVAERDFDRITERAASFVNVVEGARE
ncbi:2-dehydro-3-deoxyphosphogluconate aldolase [Halobacteriales archaeon QS_1_68_20]|nr:MAG: 2-dehydro-3-deoxyphosphogluconate aldolase [Halobacteriales archaeon QS_1_68_20]